MARIDKTDSAIGMIRVEGGWSADAATTGEIDTPIGVGITTTGLLVKGAGNTGIVGISVRSKTFRREGDVGEFIRLGEIVEVTGLAAGSKVYAVPATGALSLTATDNILIGYTIEADRLVVTL